MARAKTHVITVENEVQTPGWDKLLRTVVRTALAAEGVTVPCEADILLTDDVGIQEINLEQRELDAPTDVLSFPAFEFKAGAFSPGDGEVDPETGLMPLGDIVISVERAKRQAEEYGHSPEREMAYLTVHAVLHLLGYDHLDNGPQQRKMRRREEAILAALDLSRQEESAMPKPKIARTAMVALVGRPNVGKSTLTNRLVGEKVAIVSSKPQTTRTRITAVVNHGDAQLVFLDTPGFHRPRSRLGDYMVKIAGESVADVDAAVLVVEPIANIGAPEEGLLERIRAAEVPALLAINKTDTVKKEELLAVIDLYRKAFDFKAIIPISARRGEGIDALIEELLKYAVPGPQLFPDGMVTDQPEKQILTEILREKLLMCLSKEIPHGTAVEINRYHTRKSGVVDLDMTIYCEKASHKGIIIGAHGEMLKKISSLARQDMERFLGSKVFLETWVRVKENWRDNLGHLRGFGYNE